MSGASKGNELLADIERAGEFSRAISGLKKPVKIRFCGETFTADRDLSVVDFYAGLREQGLEAYSDGTGALCIRTIAEGNLHRAKVAEEREERDRARRDHAERVRREVAALRAQAGQCIRSFSCLRRAGHDGPCAYDVRTLAALGEEPASNATPARPLRSAS